MLELLLLVAFCVLVGLACVATIGWTLLSGVEIGIERIFLLHVAGVMALLFFGLAGWIVARSPLRTMLKPAAAPQSAANPAAKEEKAPEEASKTVS
jgi:hypothetical protein